MLNYFKNDFRSVRYALEQLFDRDVPYWGAFIWYIVIGILVMPLMPFIMIWYKIKMHRMMKEIEDWEKE